MIAYNDITGKLPPAWKEDLVTKNRSAFLNSGFTWIILDDDPTGTQTMYDVPVLTSWEADIIEAELNANTPVFFILTNSRSLSSKKADDLAREIGKNILTASRRASRKVLVISRGDSTLRGHYPNEVDALGEGLGTGHSPHIIIPAFFEGGRFTIGDIHYVREGEFLIPAGETQFAKDSAFGYRSSDLKDYVEEKSSGRIKASQVHSISIEDIRIGGYERVANVLKELKEYDVCVVNAAEQDDLNVFAAGFYNSVAVEKPVLFRTAASVIPSLAGMHLKHPLQKMPVTSGSGGIVAIGSYVPKTSIQLEYLKNHLPLVYLEIDVTRLLNEEFFNNEVSLISDKVNDCIQSNRIVIIYTSRQVVTGINAEESLDIVNQVSKGMVEIVKNIHVQPHFFIAKGGITSSDIATKGLGVKKAKVLGQIVPGVPVWQLNEPCRFPDMMYIPFPGNLGEENTIAVVINKLKHENQTD